MDMKKILQALDGASSKPVEGSNDMKKFMEIVTEGSNPHKVALPVQMAMQHYQQPTKTVTPKANLTRKYFAEAEQEIAEKQAIAEQRKRMYARKIADKIRLKESASVYDIFTEEPEDNPPDVVKLDIPLLIRLLEYAREDAETDMDLHNVADMLIKLSGDGDTLSMNHYDQIVGDQKLLPEPDSEITTESCWKSHKQVGMKKKGSRMVPNCVPKEK